MAQTKLRCCVASWEREGVGSVMRNSPAVPDRRAVYRRLVALGPALLLHVGLLILFLRMNWTPFSEGNLSGHEIFFLLKPAPAVPNWQGDLLPPIDSTATQLPHLALSPMRMYAFAPTNEIPAASPEEVASELRGVSGALFKCWPNDLAGLTQVKAEQCLTLTPDRSSGFLEPPEESRNAAEWLRDWTRQNAPLRLPCTYGLSTATVFCVATGLINGFDLKNAASYVEDDNDLHMNGVDTIRHEMQTVDPCALDKTAGLDFVCLYRVLNGNTPP
ncbi:MAG TPA: hypothetical protein VMF67_14135 [Rhizomicrobium sp.]|nr:hypothetical protein [Rhizomicrobium sp.]